MNLSPILLFVYNRPDHTQKTLEALKLNKLASESELIIYSDAPKNESAVEGVLGVRKLIKNLIGFKKITIIEREKNWGLAPSVIDGVTRVVNEFGKVIVLEDDLVTNQYFLQFMNQGLLKYENEDQVISIHGFIYPIENLPPTFFIRGADCWGWATWKRGWDLFNPDGKSLLAELKSRNLRKNFDYNGAYAYTKMLRKQIAGEVSSWAVRWYASAFLKNKLTLYPGKSLVKNIGYDDGTNCFGGDDEPIFGTLAYDEIKLKDIPITHDEISHAKITRFFKIQKKSFFRRVISKINRLLLYKG